MHSCREWVCCECQRVTNWNSTMWPLLSSAVWHRRQKHFFTFCRTQQADRIRAEAKPRSDRVAHVRITQQETRVWSKHLNRTSHAASFTTRIFANALNKGFQKYWWKKMVVNNPKKAIQRVRCCKAIYTCPAAQNCERPIWLIVLFYCNKHTTGTEICAVSQSVWNAWLGICRIIWSD